MSGRCLLTEAERKLERAGYRTEREQHPSVNNGKPVFLAVRPARKLGGGRSPTRLEVRDGCTVSEVSITKLLNKAPNKS